MSGCQEKGEFLCYDNSNNGDHSTPTSGEWVGTKNVNK